MPLPSKESMSEPKTFSELIVDPHFVFTLFSLFASICVFFYYLFQLLFRTNNNGWKNDSDSAKSNSSVTRKLSGSKLGAPPPLAAAQVAAAGGSGTVGADGGSPTRRKLPSPKVAEEASLKRQQQLVDSLSREIELLQRRVDHRRQMLEQEVARRETEGGESNTDEDDEGHPVGGDSGVAAAEDVSKVVEAIASASVGPTSELRKRRARKEE